MSEPIERVKLHSWYEKRVQRINQSCKAGFVVDDDKLTNPLKIKISPNTLKLLKEKRDAER